MKEPKGYKVKKPKKSSKRKQTVCEDCGKKFPDYSKLKSHKRKAKRHSGKGCKRKKVEKKEPIPHEIDAKKVD